MQDTLKHDQDFPCFYVKKNFLHFKLEKGNSPERGIKLKKKTKSRQTDTFATSSFQGGVGIRNQESNYNRSEAPTKRRTTGTVLFFNWGSSWVRHPLWFCTTLPEVKDGVY